MKRKHVGERWRAMFACPDGNLYDSMCTERKRGVRVDYFIRLPHSGDILVTAHLDRHEAKARLARVAPYWPEELAA